MGNRGIKNIIFIFVLLFGVFIFTFLRDISPNKITYPKRVPIVPDNKEITNNLLSQDQEKALVDKINLALEQSKKRDMEFKRQKWEKEDIEEETQVSKLSQTIEEPEVEEEEESIELQEEVEVAQTVEDPPDIDFYGMDDLLQSRKPQEVYKIVLQYAQTINQEDKDRDKWENVVIQLVNQLADSHHLMRLYDYFPSMIQTHEQASLKIAQNFLKSERMDDYESLRNIWKTKKNPSEKWSLLDADQMILENNVSELLPLLTKTPFFNSEAEVGRLTRLSLLYFYQKPELAWEYLEDANLLDPTNSTVRKYRSTLLENTGQYSRAYGELLSAVNANPSDLHLKNHLADFLVRHQKYQEVLGILKDQLLSKIPEDMWLKTYFWNKVLSPLDVNWEKSKMTPGKMQPLIQYVKGLDMGEFWDEKKFDSLYYSKQYLGTSQETYWLKLLDCLKNDCDSEALSLLKSNPFMANSWNPHLEQAIKQILLFRSLYQSSFPVNMDKLSIAMDRDLRPKHEFYKELDTYFQSSLKEVPTEVEDFLLSKEAIITVLLASNWSEAALLMKPYHKVNGDLLPQWAAYRYTKSLKENRENDDALKFAKRWGASSPQLMMMIGEIFLEEGDLKRAYDVLVRLISLDSDVGYRASYLTAGICITNKQYEQAKKIVRANEKLYRDVAGKEILGKIASLEGDTKKAEQIYSSIENRSSEAKSYLARRAFAEKNWKRARELTEKLIAEHPNNPVLEDNLEKIKLYQEQS